MYLRYKKASEAASVPVKEQAEANMSAFIPAAAIHTKQQQNCNSFLSTSTTSRPGNRPLHQLPNTSRLYFPNQYRPSSSSGSVKMTANQSTTPMPGANDLLIIGAGVLGRLIASEWQTLYPQANVIGETRTPSTHSDLESLNIQPAIAGATDKIPPYIVFCAPPSGSPNYPLALEETVNRIKEAKQQSRLVFTSSGSVHGPSVELITESTEQDLQGERSKLLAQAENNVLEYENGIVVRLSGLYTLQRGAHSFWLRNGSAKSAQDRHLNLIHYKDAAKAVVNSLKISKDDMLKWPRKTLLACCDTYVTPLECCEVSLKHPLFDSYKMPVFEGADSKRVYDNQWTRQVLSWKPEWETFTSFMEGEIELSKSQK